MMTFLTISQDIRPISDLKSKASEIIDCTTSSNQLAEALQEGERDYEVGRVSDHEDVKARWLAKAGREDCLDPRR